MADHDLKTDPEVFQSSWEGLKNFEIRFDDRGYAVNDGLTLRETRYSSKEMHNIKTHKPLEYTGRVLYVKVKYILRGNGYGLLPGWVILDVSEPDV